MKNKIIILFVIFKAHFCFSQNDSVHALFSNIHYSYLLENLHYDGFAQDKNLILSGMGFDMGAVFNKKLFMGIGLASGADAHEQYEPYDPRNQTNGNGIYYFIFEYLVRPNKTVNFSFPLRIGGGFLSYSDSIPSANSTTGSYYGFPYYYHYQNYFVISPGANVFVNVFKYISLGAGINYRFVTSEYSGVRRADYNNFSIIGTLRFRFDTKAYRKKTLDRMKAFREQGTNK